MFVVDRVGGNLPQITGLVDPDAALAALSVSDDATRIATACDGDPLGNSAILGTEIFAVEANGSDLRQPTTTATTFSSSAPSLSGNDPTIAFQSNGDLTGGNAANQTQSSATDWCGTGLRQVTTTTVLFGFTRALQSSAPSITDEGQVVYNLSNQNSSLVDRDGNLDIVRINENGPVRTQITSSVLDVGSLARVAAGSGSRLTFLNVGAAIQLVVDDGLGGYSRTLVTFDLALKAEHDLSRCGSRVIFVRSTVSFGRIGSGARQPTGRRWRE